MNRYKYPRTLHLPYSPGVTSDDKVVDSTDHFIGQTILITEKMDGENTTVYCDGYIHARSIDGKSHPSRNWVKQYFADKFYLIPDNTRICGENFYAVHSIEYGKRDCYFSAFSTWEDEYCMDWDSTILTCEYIGINTVPVLYYGKWVGDSHVLSIAQQVVASGGEGIVVRNSGLFHADDFSKNVAKYVRPGHVQTDKHWSKSWRPQHG